MTKGKKYVRIRFDGNDEIVFLSAMQNREKVRFAELVLDRKQCIFKKICVPAISFAEACKMAEFELPAIIPLSVEDVVYGCRLLGQKDAMVELEICIVRQSVVDGYVDVCREANLEVRRVVYDGVEELGKDFNLLPRIYLERLRRKSVLMHCAVTAGLCLAAVLSLVFVSFAIDWRFDGQVEYLKGEIGPIENIASQIDVRKRQLTAINSQLLDRGMMVGVLSEVYKFVPEGVTISELKISERGGSMAMNLSGRAKKISQAFDCAKAAQGGRYIGSMNIENVQQVPMPGGKSIVEFRGYCPISNRVVD